MPCRLFLTLIALGLLPGLIVADEVQVLNSKTTITGTISSISATQVIIKTDDGEESIPLDKVLKIKIRDVKPADLYAKITDVVLTDGTLLHCQSLTFEGKEAELKLPSGIVLKVPMSAIVSYVNDANNQPLTQKFEELAAKKSTFDRIVILRAGALNTLEGTLGEVKGNTISFKSKAGEVEIPLEKLHGIIFFRPPTAAPATPICRVNDIEGNTLTAVKLTHDGDKVMLTTTLGTELELPHRVLANLDFNMDKLNYLSDMTPIKIVEKSSMDRLDHAFRRDTNLDGDGIVLLDKAYAKGLSLHAYTDLEYNLAGKFKEFRGILGVDPRTGSESQPIVNIYCDGKVVFTSKIEVGSVQPVSLNVKGVKTLRIEVNSKNALYWYRDHVTLAEAKVSQ